MWDAELSHVCCFSASALLQICPLGSFSYCLSLHVSLHFVIIFSLWLFLVLLTPLILAFHMPLNAWNALCCSSMHVHISEMQGSLQWMEKQFTSPPPKPPPSPHCQTVIRVKPGVSPTVPEGADLSTTSFHLCLNATALKADIHTPRRTHAHTYHLPGFFDCATLIAHHYSLLLITLVSCLKLKMLPRKRMNSKSEWILTFR